MSPSIMRLCLLLLLVVPAFSREIECNANLWEKKTVCLKPDHNSDVSKDLLLKAEQKIMDATCVNFVEDTDPICSNAAKDRGAVQVTGEKGCYADIGEFEDHTSNLNLQYVCKTEGIIIHELMHTLGRFHEQSRNDRDSYVTVLEDNILENYRGNFYKCNSEQQLYDTEYDFESIMHYGKNYFSVDKKTKDTLTLNAGYEDYENRIGVQTVMSPKDVIFINKMYDCYDGTPDHSICQHGGVLQDDGNCYCVDPYEGTRCEKFRTSSNVNADYKYVVKEIEYDGTDVSFSSQNWPNEYNENLHEVFVLRCKDHSLKAEVQFSDFDLEAYECHYDRMLIYFGVGSVNPILKTCGGEEKGKTEKSTDFQIVLELISDDMYTYTGFEATFKCV